MVLLAGPNGAGKSTLYETRIAPSLLAPFVNADLIQRDELGDASPEAAYRAARIAADRRRDYLAGGKSFATETVFSHPSKLDLVRQAKARGFAVLLYHIGVATADLSVARVRGRVGEGGHPVPERKIRDRYLRQGPLVREAMLLSDRGQVFDNSRLNTPPERVIGFVAGKVTFAVPDLPEWAYAIYRRDFVR
jgi:predicted ABC-type ATPase